MTPAATRPTTVKKITTKIKTKIETRRKREIKKKKFYYINEVLQ